MFSFMLYDTSNVAGMLEPSEKEAINSSVYKTCKRGSPMLSTSIDTKRAGKFVLRKVQQQMEFYSLKDHSTYAINRTQNQAIYR